MTGTSKADAAAAEVSLCGPADREEQTRLFNACFKKQIGVEALRWRYDRNPHGAAVSLLSRVPGAGGVSGYACSPRLAVPFGDERRAAAIGETGDVMTHPDWRKQGLFSALDKACMQETARLGWPLVFGLPNRRSAHIFLELGWQAIATVRPWTFVLASGAAARAERAREGRVAGWLTPLGLLRGARARRRLAARGASHSVRAIERFPAEVEALSREVEARHSLMVRRDRHYLDWRFCESPSGLHRALGVFDARGAFAGYAVIQVPRPGETQGFLVDVLAPSPEALSAALAAALSELEKSGAAVVRATAIDGSWWNERLVEAGFLAPKPDNYLSVILHVHDAAHPLVAAAREPRRWYLTDGDRDDETMG